MGWGGGGGWDQGGCEPRIKVIVKMYKKGGGRVYGREWGGGGGAGVSADINQGLKLM